MSTHALDEKPADTLTQNSLSADDKSQVLYDNEKPLSRTASRASRNTLSSRHSRQSRFSRPPSRAPSDAEVAAALDEGVAAEHADSELPNGGYGWVVVVCILALNACTWGLVTTFNVVNKS